MNTQTVIPNLVKPDLRILFVGINPGLRSAAIGHHFAGHSNRFWRLLHDSGITPIRFKAEDDYRLLELDFGITNIVSRSSATAAELTRSEFQEGASILLKLMEKYHPTVAAYLGKDIYRHLVHRNKVDWGKQEPPVLKEVIDFVLPNPSGLNRMPYQEQLKWFLELREFK